MAKSRIIATLVVALSVALAGCLSGADESKGPDKQNPTPTTPTPTPTTPRNVSFHDGFEGGFDGWDTDFELPDDPNNPGHKVWWNISRSLDKARSGNSSLNFSIDGSQDDGTIWIVRELDVTPGQRYDARLTADGWSASESFNTIAHLVMYVGTTAPRSESDFGEAGKGSDGAKAAGLREPLNAVEGWKEYALDWTGVAPSSGKVYVAVGITMVWETHANYYVDDVSVELSPK